ncbi:MAG: WHG domain-containing protein [Actinomycetota bacterium]|nr:WHG domain-containing protein [Actinomycetota bacterium]
MPRAGLSTDVVVAEAARVADEVGFDRLTLAAVAERLGVRLPSLYKHIAGLDELRRRLAVLAVSGLGDAITTAAVGRAGTDALLAVADAYRVWAQAHPGLYQASLRAPDPLDADHMAASDAALAVVRAVLAGYGLRDDDVIDATRALRSALHGFVSLEAAGGFGLPRDVDRSYTRLVTAVDSVFADWC